MEEEELMHVNPCPPSWLSDEQKAVLRGDNIEGTAYTQRWILNTLMTILKALHELLPLLQRDTNLTTYDFTPRKCPADDPATPHHLQSLPDQTPTFSPQHTNGFITTPKHDLPDNHAATVQQQEEDPDPVVKIVVEVPTDVDNAACQLWNMCGDRNVALHVLQLNDNLVLHMLSYTLRDPTAPRLTEILCGVVCNLCCQREGCEVVLADQSLLLLLTSLPERCADTPAVKEALRLLHRLLCHCRHRVFQQSSANGDKSTVLTNVSTSGAKSGSQQSISDGPSQSGTNGVPLATSGSSATNPTADDPAIALTVALHSCDLEQFLAFILGNSFCEELVIKTVEVLSELLFFKDPHSGKMMADYYAESGLVPGLLRLVSNWHSQKQLRQGPAPADEDEDEEEEEEERDYFEGAASNSFRADKKRDVASAAITDTVQKVFVCLYAFVDTKGADAIVSSVDDELRLEPALVYYISELVSRTEAELRRHKSHQKPVSPSSSHPPTDDDKDCAHSYRLLQSAENLGHAVKLLELLVRSVSLPEVNLSLARLLALLDHSGVFWEEDEAMPANTNQCFEGDVVRSNSCSDERLLSEKVIRTTDLSKMPPMRSKSCGESTSVLKSHHKSINKERKKNPNKTKNILDHFDILAAVNSSPDAKSKKAQDYRQTQIQLELNKQVILSTGSRCRRRSSVLQENSFNDVTQVRDAEEISCLSSTTLGELQELKRDLEKYFASILHYWFTFGDLKSNDGALCRILRVLEQCHVHELLLVLHALRKFDHALVPKVQEMLLDHQAFPRIVALLSKLYQ